MKLLAAILAAIVTGITAAAANAAGPALHPVLGWAAHSTVPTTNVRYRYVDRYGRYFYLPRNCCVTGPAYGVPGEPLGPAYNTDLWMPNPSTCGPGACQDNPWY